MRVVVVALGKIGLPLAAHIAAAGHDVTGCDIDSRVVDLVNDAVEPFPGETGLAEALAQLVPAGRLRASADTAAAVAEGPELVIAVAPLAVDRTAAPDYAMLDAAVDEIGRGLRRGSTVSIETTVPVGTTRNRVAPALARRSGLHSEQDFHTVHSPERVYSGRVFQDLATYPKLVGGLSEAGERRAVSLYESFIDAEVRGMAGAETAELTKLAETTYRDVNIALANEFAIYADSAGVDIGRVIDAANTQPFSHIHRPGIAVGGHCIPVYPRFYLAGHAGAALPTAARAVNEGMPAYAVGLVAEAFGGELVGRRVLILGVAYRGGVKEAAFSGAFPLDAALREVGASPLASDPLYTDEELTSLGLTPWDGRAVEAAIVQADHAQYATLTPDDVPGALALVDGRGIVDRGPWVAAGIAVRRIGGG
ncbi:MAG: nucleotide sugar dehydrogenase [Solirubrobacteraceae bacterium]